MAGAEYWIWLQKAFGPRSSLACKLIARFGDPEKLYCAGREGWIASGLLKDKQCDKLCQQSPSEAFDVLMLCMKHGLDVVTPDSPCYPKQLLRIPDYPLVLYVKGRTSALQAPVMTAVVGTRKASRGGIQFTRDMTATLAREGVAVVSGGALGIDTAAHEGALSAGGITIVVMGCGLGCDYLMQNEAMRKMAGENGAVISEFLPETPPNKSSFPTRNRILAGMSQATVVVEAAEKSGSFITAGDALRMQRMVFAVPSAVSGSFYSGTDKLIREKKAYSVTHAQEILKMLHLQNGDWSQAYEEVLHAAPAGIALGPPPEIPVQVKMIVPFEELQPLTGLKKEKKPTTKKTVKKEQVLSAEQPAPAKDEPPEWLTGDLLTVRNALQDGAKSPDDLVCLTGLPPGKVLVAISKLEFKNAVERDFGCVRLK